MSIISAVRGLGWRASTAVLILGVGWGCGGGPVPGDIGKPRVVVDAKNATKRLVVRDDRLNLVKRIIPAAEGTFLVFGNHLACTVSTSGSTPRCVTLDVDLSDLDVVANEQGMPSLIVGSGLWGKPSVAVLEMTGRVKWRFDGGFDLMGTPYVMHTAQRGIVTVDGRTFDLSTGARLTIPNCGCGAVGSADFNHDGKRELLVGEKGKLRIMDGGGRELQEVDVADDHWDEPLVVVDGPFVVLSKNEHVVVYDDQLKPKGDFATVGAKLPFHASAAAFTGELGHGPFAVLLRGRGGWHETFLFVYSAEERVVYQEILGDDFESMTAVPRKDGGVRSLSAGAMRYGNTNSSHERAAFRSCLFPNRSRSAGRRVSVVRRSLDGRCRRSGRCSAKERLRA